MKISYLLVIFSGLLLLNQSCAPVYRCGEERPAEGTLPGGNRLNLVVQERDSLCDDLKVKQEEVNYLLESNNDLKRKNSELVEENKGLRTKYDDLMTDHEDLKEEHERLSKENMKLQKDYSNLFTDNFTQAHLYDERLKNKERMLAEKERELELREKRIEELEAEIARQDSIARRLNQLLKEALLGFNAEELQIEIKNGKVYVSMSDKLLFKSGSANIEKKGVEAINILAGVLKKNPDFQIMVEGHTDDDPISTSRYKDNWDLSLDRAASIVRILTKENDVNPKRITAAGRSEFQPRASNETKEGKAKNRRTEIILSPKLEELMQLIQD